MSFQLQWIDINMDLPIAATEGLRHRCAGDTGDLVTHLELREILQICLVQASSFKVTRQTG